MKLAVIVALSLAVSLVQAQAPAPPAGPQPTGIVVGSGSFFSPIVQDLDRAVTFYRDGLGFEVSGQPGEGNPALRDMFGLPDAKISWQVGRAPGIAGSLEMILIREANGKALQRRMQDPGAVTLLVLVRDIDAVAGRLKQLGVPVLTAGGVPALVPMGGAQARMLMVRDPDDHFVEIVQPPQIPVTAAPATSNIVEVRLRLTVDSLDRALRLYHDILGLELVSRSEFVKDAAVSAAFGLPGAQFRFGALRVPTSGLTFEVMEFKGVTRKQVRGRIQDPGSTRMQLRVRNVEEAVAALSGAGGVVVSAGGKPLDLSTGPNALHVAMDREHDNLFLVLIGANATVPATAPAATSAPAR